MPSVATSMSWAAILPPRPRPTPRPPGGRPTSPNATTWSARPPAREPPRPTWSSLRPAGMSEPGDNVMMAVPRPRVEALLARAWRQRVTLVAAGGGHGKTTALRRLAATGPSRWLRMRPVDGTVELLAARIAEALELGAIPGLADPAAGTG